MIEIPLNLIIDSIEDCCFIHFKDIKFPSKAPAHYYFVIPSNEASKVFYIISMITTKVEENLYYYQKTPTPKAAQSLVRLKKGSFKFIVDESAINCNMAEKLTKGDLLRKIDKNIGIEVMKRKIDAALKEKIISAIMNSPLVTPALKSTLKTIS